jgi:putative ABC transport system substrate-binding protein
VLVAARAQTAQNARRIGILEPGAQPAPAERQDESAALRELGWVEGKNLLVERRYANNRAELLQPLADELVRLKVEVLVTGGTAATLAARNATTTIPIVFRSAGDPVRAGLVASLARPGGNVTGYSTVSPELEAKRLSLLREVLPGLQRVGYLVASVNPYFRLARDDFQQACRSLAIHPIFIDVAAAGELANAVAEIARQRGQVLIVPAHSMFTENLVEIGRAARMHALPTMVQRDVSLQDSGALLSFGPTAAEEGYRNAAYVDRILRGARPADLPVEQPTRFELGINLGTAKALGITIPQSLLLRADEVIR